MGILNPEYNICSTAGSTAGRLHSDETQAKIAKAMVGLKRSEKTKAKIAKAGIGRKFSEETRKKIGEAMGTSVKVIDTETGITTIYPSKRQVAREFNTSLDTVRRYIISRKAYKDRYLIEILIEN